MVSQMTEMRVRKLGAFGTEAVLARTISDAKERRRALHAIAGDRARVFDANSLLILSKAMTSFDVTEKLDRIRCPVLFALSRADRVFPPSGAPVVMKCFRQAGVEARYIMKLTAIFGIPHLEPKPEKWAPELRAFLADVVMKERITA
jgi:homoserine O-acetyltransferase